MVSLHLVMINVGAPETNKDLVESQKFNNAAKEMNSNRSDPCDSTTVSYGCIERGCSGSSSSYTRVDCDDGSSLFNVTTNVSESFTEQVVQPVDTLRSRLPSSMHQSGRTIKPLFPPVYALQPTPIMQSISNAGALSNTAAPPASTTPLQILFAMHQQRQHDQTLLMALQSQRFRTTVAGIRPGQSFTIFSLHF